jgi:hypothetical protein
MIVTIGWRELLAALGGGAAAWPLAARAQQGERVRRIAVLSSLAADDPETQARHAAFLQGLPGMGLDLRAGLLLMYLGMDKAA